MDEAIKLSKEYDRKHKVSIVAKPRSDIMQYKPKYSVRLDKGIKR